MRQHHRTLSVQCRPFVPVEKVLVLVPAAKEEHRLATLFLAMASAVGAVVQVGTGR